MNRTPPGITGTNPDQPLSWPTGQPSTRDSSMAGRETAVRDAVFAPLAAHDPHEIGGYPLQARIGEGGMGAVYLSRTPGGRSLALKVVRSEFSVDPDFRARFAKEVAIAQRVQGPYTVPVIDADADAARPWIATAYVPAPSLAIAVSRAGGLPPTTVLALIAGIAEALQSIHRVGVIHRDLKPGNVILAPDGPRVIDFGVARAIDAATAAMTQTGTRLGTPAFMAPEQVRGMQLDRAGDVFALGATAYYALTGRPPFGIDAAVFHRIEHHQPDWDGCPDDVRDVLARCMEKNPGARPTPAELIELCGWSVPHERLPAADLSGTGEGWLPPTVTAEITRYRVAPLPAPPGPPPEVPTLVPPGSSPGSSRAAGKPAGRSWRGRAPWIAGAVAAALVVSGLTATAVTRAGEATPGAPAVVTAGTATGAATGASAGTQAGAKAGDLDLAAPAPGPPTAPTQPPLAGPPPGAAPPPSGGPAVTTPKPPAGTAAPGAVPPPAPPPRPTSTPSPAATGCPGSPSHEYNGDGYGILTEAAALRSGPYAACGSVTNLAKGKKVWLHCSVVNGNDTLWWWARLEGTSTAGWIYNGDLKISYVDDNEDGRTRIYRCNGTYTDR